MKIGIDYRPALLSRTGIGRYTREITAAMAAQLAAGEELHLFGVSMARADAVTGPPPERPPAGAVLARKRFPGRLLHLLGRLGVMGVETFTGPLDVFLYSDLVYPPLKRAAHCVTIHDLAFLRSESFHEKGFGRTVWKRMQPVLESAAGVIVPSQATAGDLERHAPACRNKIHVVAHGCDHLLSPAAGSERLPAAAAALGSFFLAMGTLEPRKNWERVLRAFESAAPSLPDTSLVFAGTPGWLHEPLMRGLETSPVRGRIRLLTGVDDAALAGLYRNALALVYPSLWEGFGFPVAEAMSLGCPVITSGRSALPETAGGAALLVDPEDVSEIAAAMIRLARERSLREDLAARGRERAGSLTWKKAARETLEVLRC